MGEGFDLPVDYNRKELLFPSKIVRFGYAYQIEIDVNGTFIRFERDDEQNGVQWLTQKGRKVKCQI